MKFNSIDQYRRKQVKYQQMNERLFLAEKLAATVMIHTETV